MKRRWKVVLIAVGALAVIAGGARLAANGWIWKKIEFALEDKYGVKVEKQSISLSLLNGEATVTGLRLLDGDDEILTADSVETSISVNDVIAGRYDFRKLVVKGLLLHAIVEKDFRLNLQRVYQRRKMGEGPDDMVRFQEGVIVNSSFVLDDAVTDPEHPAHLLFVDLQAATTWLQVAGEADMKEFGDVRLDAKLAQQGGPAYVSMVGWMRALTAKPSMAVHAAVTGLDLSQMPQYVDKTTRFALGGDVMHIVASMRVKEDVILEGAIVGEVPAVGAVLPMKFGGTLQDPVFDDDSRMAAIFKLPWVHLGHFGDVAIGSAWGLVQSGAGAVEGLGEGVYGAGAAVVGGVGDTFGDLVALDPLGALQAAGGGVVGTVSSLGGAVLGGFKRIILGSDSPEDSAKAAERQQTVYREIHDARRRAMLEAALKSARNPKRRSRLEALIADIPGAVSSPDAESAPR